MTSPPVEQGVAEAVDALDSFAKALERGDELTWFDGRKLHGIELATDLRAVLQALSDAREALALAGQTLMKLDATNNALSDRELNANAQVTTLTAEVERLKQAMSLPMEVTVEACEALTAYNTTLQAKVEAMRAALEQLNGALDAMWNDDSQLHGRLPAEVHCKAIIAGQEMCRLALSPTKEG